MKLIPAVALSRQTTEPKINFDTVKTLEPEKEHKLSSLKRINVLIQVRERG